MKLTPKNKNIAEKSLYPNTLFHFTNEFLLDIIKDKFLKPHMLKRL
jgi:hypothetical protein